MEIAFFRAGDPDHTLLGRDGSRIPKGPAVAELRERLGGDAGRFRDPFGNEHPIHIPDAFTREDGWHAAICFEVPTKRTSL